jgi:hypothetical protein
MSPRRRASFFSRGGAGGFSGIFEIVAAGQGRAWSGEKETHLPREIAIVAPR